MLSPQDMLTTSNYTIPADAREMTPGDQNLNKARHAPFLPDAALYDGLLKKAIEPIAATFRKRVATGLQTGRSFKIPNQKGQAQDTTDFERVTWLVIKKP
jgi:hypothetical protein